MDNYYKILGVKDFASLDEIKTAYRKLSKKFHPDMNEGDKFFEEWFKEIQNAYEILTDSSRKRMHDAKLRDHAMQDQNFYSADDHNEKNNAQQNQSENDKDHYTNQPTVEANTNKQPTKAKPAASETKNTPGKPKVEKSASSKNPGYLVVSLVVIGIVILILVFGTKSTNTNNAERNSNIYNSSSTPRQYSVPDTIDLRSSKENVLKSESGNFTIGSSKARVLKIQGNPTSILKFETNGEEMWYYGTSSVTFKKGKVSEYSNLGSNLNVIVSLSEKDLNENNDPFSSSQIPTSIHSVSTKKHKSSTKWLYFSCTLSDFDHTTNYYSKIYEVTNYTDNKGLKIKDCLIEQLKFFTQTEQPIFLIQHEYGSYSDASNLWSLESGKKIFGDDRCAF